MPAERETPKTYWAITPGGTVQYCAASMTTLPVLVVVRLTQSHIFENGAPGASAETSPRERAKRPPPTSSFVVDAQVTFSTKRESQPSAALCFCVDIFLSSLRKYIAQFHPLRMAGGSPTLKARSKKADTKTAVWGYWERASVQDTTRPGVATLSGSFLYPCFPMESE